MPRRLLTIDDFAPEAKALRAHFEQRFGDPHSATEDRFVWDLWSVPGQYTALRTPAWRYFPEAVYRRFHERLVWWGRRALGCHDVSPPWLSSYVNGCEQRLHADVPHGHWAFVFSLTPWKGRTFRGGETLLLKEGVLDFWRDFDTSRRVEEGELLDAVEPRFNRLTVFDPRTPHGVRRVEGSMDPREGRLVVHGWFVQPRPFIEGPLKERELATCLASLGEVVGEAVSAGLPISGLLSVYLDVEGDGSTAGVKVLSDTTRVPFEFERARRRLVKGITRHLRAYRFGRQRGLSRVTLPLVFER